MIFKCSRCGTLLIEKEKDYPLSVWRIYGSIILPDRVIVCPRCGSKERLPEWFPMTWR